MKMFKKRFVQVFFLLVSLYHSMCDFIWLNWMLVDLIFFNNKIKYHQLRLIFYVLGKKFKRVKQIVERVLKTTHLLSIVWSWWFFLCSVNFEKYIMDGKVSFMFLKAIDHDLIEWHGQLYMIILNMAPYMYITVIILIFLKCFVTSKSKI